VYARAAFVCRDNVDEGWIVGDAAECDATAAFVGGTVGLDDVI